MTSNSILWLSSPYSRSALSTLSSTEPCANYSGERLTANLRPGARLIASLTECFIRIAEDLGLIVSIGDWAFQSRHDSRGRQAAYDRDGSTARPVTCDANGNACASIDHDKRRGSAKVCAPVAKKHRSFLGIESRSFNSEQWRTDLNFKCVGGFVIRKLGGDGIDAADSLRHHQANNCCRVLRGTFSGGGVSLKSCL